LLMHHALECSYCFCLGLAIEQCQKQEGQTCQIFGSITFINHIPKVRKSSLVLSK
jgi:hypothetical protein